MVMMMRMMMVMMMRMMMVMMMKMMMVMKMKMMKTTMKMMKMTMVMMMRMMMVMMMRMMMVMMMRMMKNHHAITSTKLLTFISHHDFQLSIIATNSFSPASLIIHYIYVYPTLYDGLLSFIILCQYISYLYKSP